MYAGGSVNFELGCDLTFVTVDDEEASEACDSPDISGFQSRSADVTLLFGGGVDVAAGPGKVTVDARYEHGFSDIADDSPSLEIKSRSFQATAGYAVSVP